MDGTASAPGVVSKVWSVDSVSSLLAMTFDGVPQALVKYPRRRMRGRCGRRTPWTDSTRRPSGYWTPAFHSN
jgi:hypothetical protein